MNQSLSHNLNEAKIKVSVSDFTKQEQDVCEKRKMKKVNLKCPHKHFLQRGGILYTIYIMNIQETEKKYI